MTYEKMTYREKLSKLRRNRFTLLMNDEERKMLATLANTMNRSQSDTVREAIRQAIARQQLEVQPNGN